MYYFRLNYGDIVNSSHYKSESLPSIPLPLRWGLYSVDHRDTVGIYISNPLDSDETYASREVDKNLPVDMKLLRIVASESVQLLSRIQLIQ